MSDYSAFLAKKACHVAPRGLGIVPELAGHLFPFQAHCVDFTLRMGCAGLFLDTGLGKTECQLEWSHHALQASNGHALILTPLAVAAQTKRRADRWGYEARVIREQSEAGPGINICNYDRLDKLDPSAFGAASLDEASILKSFTGKTTRALTEAFSATPFRLLATATPAPNDHTEIGNHAGFLGLMAMNEMLSRFFINDTSTASHEWRLKGHAEQAFWDWMASWARMAEKPSDLGDSDDGFILPPVEVSRHRAADSGFDNTLADLFGVTSVSATNLHDLKRQTVTARADVVGSLVASESSEPWIIWCDTNYEADELRTAIPSAHEVRGSQSIDEKEEILEAFSLGQIKHLIAKPSMCGFGLDWSHVARMAFVGRSYSYETYYQAVRRAWRFGQKRTIKVHLVVAEGEDEIGRVIDRKSSDHDRMKENMRAAMFRATGLAVRVKAAYQPTHHAKVPSWIRSVA